MTLATATSLASFLFVLAYLLWSDWAGRAQRLRNRRTAGKQEYSLVWGLTFFIPFLVSISVGVTVTAWQRSTKMHEPPELAHVPNMPTFKCTPSPQQPKASTLICEVDGQFATVKTELEVKPTGDTGPKFELLFAALGIFVTMVTAISMAVAKNATDEARRAGENVNDLRTEFDRIAQSKQRAVLAAIQTAELYTVGQLNKSDLLGQQLNINPTPLLEEKLRFLEGMMRWGQSDFLEDELADDAASLLAHLDNPLYLPKLKHFFNERDIAACEALIQAIREESYGATRKDATAISRLLRRLKSL